MCTGVFDLLHVGHVRFLRAARAAGRGLLVGVEDDPRVRRRKGPTRPLIGEVDRAEMVAALSVVDGVFLVHGPEDLWIAEAYAELLRGLSPAALAITAGDPAELGKRRAAQMLGIDVVAVAPVAHRSTTDLIARAQLTPGDQAVGAGRGTARPGSISARKSPVTGSVRGLV